MEAQKLFDKRYITSSEIIRRLGVTRAAIIQARQKGILPEAIMVENHISLWERDAVEPYVAEWQRKRNERIGVI